MVDLSRYRVIDFEVKHDPTKPGLTKFGAVIEVYCAAYCDERGAGVVELHWKPGTNVQEQWEALRDNRIPVFHHAAYDLAILLEMGVPIDFDFECTFVMGYDLNPNMRLIQQHGMKPSRYGLAAWGVRLNFPKMESPGFDEWSEEMIPYAKRDGELTWKVLELVLPKLLQDVQAWNYYQNVDKPFILIIIELNQTGLYVDQEKLEEWVVSMQPELDAVELKLKELTDGYWFPGKTTWHKRKHDRDDGYYTEEYNPNRGYKFIWYSDFNPNSSGHVLLAYEVLYGVHLESTESDYLRDNFSQYEFTEIFTQFRKLTKLIGTYCKPFKVKADDDGYVRGEWKQELITGRISCVDPPLQTLPSRDELGSTFRKFITSPDPDWVLVGIDLSNIELRVLASMQAQYFMEHWGYIPDDIKYVIDIFCHDPDSPEGDYHGVMAKLWGIDRRSSKSVTFGRTYGSGLKKFCSQLKISLKEGRKLRASADKNNPSFKQFHEWVIEEFYEGRGLSHTMFGRRLVYPSFNLNPYSDAVQVLPTGEAVSPEEVSGALARGERQAFNAKIQGTAADILKKLCIITVPIAWECGGRLLAQVHDELLFLIPRENIVQFMVPLVQEFNNSNMLPYVPIAGKPKIGDSWYEVH